MKKKEPGADARVGRTVMIVDDQEFRKLKADAWLAKRVSIIAMTLGVVACLSAVLALSMLIKII